MSLHRVAKLLGAQPRGTAQRWYTADCPECGTERSLALTPWGAECRWDGCRWTTSDVRRVLARWLAHAGRSQDEIAHVVRRVS